MFFTFSCLLLPGKNRTTENLTRNYIRDARAVFPEGVIDAISRFFMINKVVFFYLYKTTKYTLWS